MAEPSHALSRVALTEYALCILALQDTEMEVLKTPVLSDIPYSPNTFSSAQDYSSIIKDLSSL